MVVYWTAGQKTKDSLIYKNIIYIFILQRRRLCVCAGDPFREVVRRPENTHEELTGPLEWPVGLSLCLRDQQTSPVRLSDQRISTFCPHLILSFQVPCRSMNILFASRVYLFVGGNRNLHTSVIFPVICWSYLRTEISVTLSIFLLSLYLFSSFLQYMLFKIWPRKQKKRKQRKK